MYKNRIFNPPAGHDTVKQYNISTAASIIVLNIFQARVVCSWLYTEIAQANKGG